jgi:hypothetical protein
LKDPDAEHRRLTCARLRLCNQVTAFHDGQNGALLFVPFLL